MYALQAHKRTAGGQRNLPEHDPKKWERFKEYCRQDVQTEQDLRCKLSRYPIPKQEQKIWELDQKINDSGVLVDMRLVENAIACDEAYQESYFQEAQKLTGLENQNSVAQLKGYIKETTGETVKSLNKEKVAEMLEETKCETVKRVLALRQKMVKPQSRNTRLWSALYAPMAGCGGCSSSTEQTVQADGQDG